jgi:Papain-like cysteine protease AvrRpt2
VGHFAQELGLTAENPQCYTVEGFRGLLERYGPLWVGSAVPFLHAIVVTGLYSDGTNAYVRITDPLDRTVGSPGAPGAYASPPTHMTGSRYIMKWEDFTTEYETWGARSAATMQIIHPGGTLGRTPNYGSATGAGYAQSLREKRAALKANGAKARLQSDDTSPTPSDPIAASGRRRDTGSAGAARWALDRYDGLHRPSGAAPIVGTPASVTLALDEWPMVRLREGDVHLPLFLAWHAAAGTVGDVVITAGDPMLVPGWSISATADVTEGPDTPTNAALTVAIRQVFSQRGKPDIVASTQLVLCGDGTYQRQDGWVKADAA